jgi:hypothetical protein
MEVPFQQTTAENLAKHWANEIQAKLPKLIKISAVEVEETDDNKAIWQE